MVARSRRAWVRIEEISAELDATRERGENGCLLPTTGKQGKAAVLKAAANGSAALLLDLGPLKSRGAT